MSARSMDLRTPLDMRGGSLSAGYRHALPAFFAALEDRAQPAHRALVLAPQPTAPAERLHQAVHGGRWGGLERVANARRAARARRELVYAERANAIVLARAPDLHYAVRSLDLGERHVGPAEAVPRRLHAKARAGAQTNRVDSRQVPLDQVVVGELRVICDVLQVLEDTLARSGDHGRHAQGVHGAGQCREGAEGAPPSHRRCG